MGQLKIRFSEQIDTPVPSKPYYGHFHEFWVIAFVLHITPRILYAAISSTQRIKMSTNWHLLWKVVAASSILYFARKLYTGKTAKQVLSIDNLILLLKPNSILSLVSSHALKRALSKGNLWLTICLIHVDFQTAHQQWWTSTINKQLLVKLLCQLSGLCLADIHQIPNQ